MFSNLNGPYASHPILSGRVKAAEARHLVHPVLDIWEDWHSSDSSFEVHMLRSLQALATMYDVLACKSYCLPAAEANRFAAACARTLRQYNVLSSRASEFGRGMSWHQVPKFHVMEHIALQAKFQNPTWSWTYVDEDFMGILGDIVQACSIATPWDKQVTKVLQKWSLGFGLRLSHQQS